MTLSNLTVVQGLHHRKAPARISSQEVVLQKRSRIGKEPKPPGTILISSRSWCHGRHGYRAAKVTMVPASVALTLSRLSLLRQCAYQAFKPAILGELGCSIHDPAIKHRSYLSVCILRGACSLFSNDHKSDWYSDRTKTFLRVTTQITKISNRFLACKRAVVFRWRAFSVSKHCSKRFVVLGA